MSVYFDYTHDEWVGDHATYDGEFVSRQTEWFATKEQAEHFSRTGEEVMATRAWADGFGNWRVEFPTTGLDIVDHEYATQIIREALLERGAIGADYIPPVTFAVSYRGVVEYMETEV